MKNALKLGFITVLLSGCSTTGYFSGTGGAIINTGVTEGQSVTAHKVGMKTGTACADNYFGIYAAGDASIATAAKNAGITNISTVERKYTNYLVIGKMCTEVTGN